MSDYSVIIEENNNALEIEASIINNLELNSYGNILETEFNDTVIYTVEVEKSETATIEINTGYIGNVVFAADVIGLDNFIANFIDNYEIDCGSP